MSKKAGGDFGVLLIGVLKLLKGVMLLALAFGVFKMVQGGVGEKLSQWASSLNVDPNNVYFQRTFTRLTSMSPKTIQAWGLGTFFYALLFMIEGVGLLMRKRWAEYFTVIVTASFLPLEVYELVKKFHATKILVIVLNLAIVVYLILKLRRSRKNKSGEAKK